MENWLGLIFVAGGALSIAGGVFDWEFFMASRKARFFVTILGRTGARVFYVLLGAGLATLGVLAMCGIVDLSKR